LLAYFGERESKNCGQCDVCKGEHQAGISNAEFKEISSRILELLTIGPLEIKEVNRNMEGNEKNILRVTRWMLDHGNIALNASGQLVIKK
jgi:ATP-dependent DNA helicase RecQ